MLRTISFIFFFTYFSPSAFSKPEVKKWITDCNYAVGEEKRTYAALSKSAGFATTYSCEDLYYAIAEKDSLDLSNSNISSLVPIEIFENITELHLSDNEIEEISSLDKLKKLTFIDLNNNKVKKINPLENLLNLRTIILSYNQITDVSPLENIELATIEISYNQVSDFTPIDHLTVNGIHQQGKNTKQSQQDLEAELYMHFYNGHL